MTVFNPNFPPVGGNPSIGDVSSPPPVSKPDVGRDCPPPTGGHSSVTTLAPPLGASRPDMVKVMAAFEEMIILMSKLAKETQVAERQSELASMAMKIATLLSAAKEKHDGAEKMMTMAVVSLVISVVASALSVVGSSIQLKGAAAGSKAVQGAGPGASLKDKVDISNLASEKLMKQGAVVDSLGKGVQAGAGFTSSMGQAEMQKSQSRSDVLQAKAEEVGTQTQKSQTMQQDMRDLLSKMVELLNAFYAAQDKISSAASH